MSYAVPHAFVNALRLLCLLLLGLLAGAWAHAQPPLALPLDKGLTFQLEQLATQGARASVAPGARVEIELGALDPRLHLAPCQKIEPYFANGHRMWGRTRIGMRCVQGATRWNVTLPLTVRVFANALVVKSDLPGGAVLSQADLREAEVDIAAEGGAVLTQAESAVGRTLARALSAGEAVRSNVLKQRQWFAAGETVTVLASGEGYTVESEGIAQGPGKEGEEVRVRFASGRVVTGRAIAERRVELDL